MPASILEPFTPENTTIVMVDHSIGFVNLFRSHTISENIRGTAALAKVARGFDTGLVVNLGKGQTPYPQLVDALGDHPIIYRGGEYNALDNTAVLKAVEKAGRPNLAIAGLTTEGCVLYTVLGALRRGYRVAVVLDATAGETREAHDIAVQRMMQLGVVPTTWLSLATELQGNWENGKTAQQYFNLIAEYSPGLHLGIQLEHQHAERANAA
jgi:nicotinamidase-related amidase